jgi:hypothetical protein
VLILERVHQLVRDDSLLVRKRQPGRKVKLLGLRLIITGDLLAQQLNYIVAQAEVILNEAELDERLARGLELLGRCVLIEVAYDRLLYLVLSLEVSLDRVLDLELAQPADDFQYLVGCVERGRIGVIDCRRPLKGQAHRSSKKDKAQDERCEGSKVSIPH